MSTQYGQFCPVAKAAELLGERWTLLIIREFLLGTTRFNDFQRALSQISPSLLTKRLNQLQDAQLIVKKTLPEQKRTEYHLTIAGKELAPIVMGLGEWGMRWARGQMTDDELDVELLMYDLRRRIDETRLPGGQTVVHFAFEGLQNFPYWWIVLDGSQRDLCVDNPGKPVDLTISTNLRTLTEVWTGDAELRQAIRQGDIKLKGSQVLARSIGEWMQVGMFAHVRPAVLSEPRR